MSSDAQIRGNDDGAGAAEEQLSRLLRTGDAQAALSSYETAYTRRRGFLLSNSDLVISLARAALAHGRPHVAGRLLHRFDKLHPGHHGLPVAYLLTARVFMCLSKYEIAIDYLEAIQRRFPSHAAADEARGILESLGDAWRAAVH